MARRSAGVELRPIPWRWSTRAPARRRPGADGRDRAPALHRRPACRWALAAVCGRGADLPSAPRSMLLDSRAADARLRALQRTLRRGRVRGSLGAPSGPRASPAAGPGSSRRPRRCRRSSPGASRWPASRIPRTLSALVAALPLGFAAAWLVVVLPTPSLLRSREIAESQRLAFVVFVTSRGP